MYPKPDPARSRGSATARVPRALSELDHLVSASEELAFQLAPRAPVLATIVRRKRLLFKEDRSCPALASPAEGFGSRLKKARQCGTCEMRQDMLVLTEEQFDPFFAGTTSSPPWKPPWPPSPKAGSSNPFAT